MPDFGSLIEIAGKALEGAGVAVIVAGSVLATVRFLLRRGVDEATSYRTFRRRLGRGILLGLEFLVAGDIIRTVVIQPTMTSVLVLGLIVVIRTFLSFTLELEITGRWPWQRPADESASSDRQDV